MRPPHAHIRRKSFAPAVLAALVLVSSTTAMASAALPPTHTSSASAIAVTVAAGYSHTCALTSAGGVKCWGWNRNGQLGNGTTNDRSTPVDVTGLASGVQSLAAGYGHTCALTSGGAVKCWGYNSNGQLGNGGGGDSSAPVDVSGLGSGAVAIAAGSTHVCALASGGVKCWGSNRHGELGDGTTEDRMTPVDVSGLTSGVAAISAGGNHTCALTSGGAVKCWGSNGLGQIGDGTTVDRYIPVDVTGLASGVVAIAAGASHTCALTSAGGVKCWGWNFSGQLGDGTAVDRHTPIDVAGLGSGVAAIAPGWEHTCALTGAAGIKCWGRNDSGQLGDGTATNRLAPVDVSGLASGITAIFGGGGHTCARTSAGGIKCWGYNSNGQLGDGTTYNRSTPVDVIGFEPPPPPPPPASRCAVPNVVGMALAKAKTRIIKRHCRVGKITRKHSSPKKKGHVISQNPKAGRTLKKGAKVNLTVGKGP